MKLETKFKTINLVFTTRKIVNITNILKGKNFEDLYFKVVNESNLDALSKIIYIFAENEAGIKAFKTSEEVYDFLDDYKEETGKDVQILLLQNHGIFVAADTEVINKEGFFKSKMSEEELKQKISNPLSEVDMESIIKASAEKVIAQVTEQEMLAQA